MGAVFGALTSLEVEDYQPGKGAERLLPARLRPVQATAITAHFVRGMYRNNTPEQTSSISTHGVAESDKFGPTGSLLYFAVNPQNPDHPDNRDMSVIDYVNSHVDQILTAATVATIVDGAARGHMSVVDRVELPAGGNELLKNWAEVSSERDIA